MGSRGLPAGALRPPRNSRAEARLVTLNLSPRALEAPPAPAGLLARTRRQWESFWSSDVARAVAPSDLPALERAFHLADLYWRAVRAKDFDQALRILPALERADSAFGLSPLARARLGVQVGEAKSKLEGFL